jgi:hypothetical protein
LEIKEIDHDKFGHCVMMTNGIIDVVVTVDFGPRIIHFGFSGDENIFYCDPERTYHIPEADPENAEDPGQTFYYYGGHRLWLSYGRLPKEIFPDNDPVVYTILPDGVRFLQPKQKITGIQAGFEIIMGSDAADIMVVHTAKNTSKETQPCGLWPVTMLAGDGVAVLPQNTDTGNPYRPNRTFVLWPGTDCHDERIFFGNRFLTVQKTEAPHGPLKIGINNVIGWAAFVGSRFTFMKRFIYSPQGVYPDFGSSCEICVENDFTELQSLSPMYRIEPGQEIRHVENLSVYRNHNSIDPLNEDGIEKYIENLS